MELWDLYNIDRTKSGKTMARGASFGKGDYHLGVCACIFNSNGEMLIQQRQSFKDWWPNMWGVAAGGNVTMGDTSQSAMERELFEEIGYKIVLQDVRPPLTINRDREFVDYYIINNDVNINELSLQHEEVQAIKWATKDEIAKMIDAGEFIPYYHSFIHLLFDMREQYDYLQHHNGE